MGESQNFQVNLRGVIELLSGHLYSGPQVYIRELLQNSVDAISARTLMEPDHCGEISFEVMSGSGVNPAPTLLVKDNGIGLTEAEVHEFLATIGQSSKRDPATRDTFLGQFGIGLLSGFMVCEEMVVITRSAKSGSKTVEWLGRSDGTYNVRVIDRDFEPGTQVYLRAKPGVHEFVEPAFVISMVTHFGTFLPVTVQVVADGLVSRINHDPPWETRSESPEVDDEVLLKFGRGIFDTQTNFLDAIPFRVESGDISGVAFVKPQATNIAGKQSHRIYLRRMLLSENADNLLPEWAFFLRAVINVNDLRPTASREALQDDEYLAAARAEIGLAIRNWLIELAKSDRDRLNVILSVHYLPMKGLAVDDDEFFDLFINWLPFETSLGRMTLKEIENASNDGNAKIRYVTSRDQFRQISGVAASQGMCVINAGYVHDDDLMTKLADLYPHRDIKRVDVSDLAQEFEDLDISEERPRVFDFLKIADLALQPFRARAEIKKFRPDNLPTLFTLNENATFLRSIETTQETTDELWGGVLDSLADDATQSSWSQLCFNFRNPLIQRLVDLGDREIVRRSIEMLYVQSLLLGHYPLKSAEMNLLSEGLRGLIEHSIGTREEPE